MLQSPSSHVDVYDDHWKLALFLKVQGLIFILLNLHMWMFIHFRQTFMIWKIDISFCFMLSDTILDANPTRIILSFSILHDNHQLSTRSNIISPLVGSIKLPPPKSAPRTTKSLHDDKSTPTHAGKSNMHATTKTTSPTCPQWNKKDGDIPQLLAKPSLDQKCKRSAKKSLTLAAIVQKEPKGAKRKNNIFRRWWWEAYRHFYERKVWN